MEHSGRNFTAPLGRVTDFYSVGCRFESCWDRQLRVLPGAFKAFRNIVTLGADVKFILVSILAVVSLQAASAEPWQLAFDQAGGATAMVSVDKNHVFGYKCLKDPPGDPVDNRLWFFSAAGGPAACLDPLKFPVNVTIRSDAKQSRFDFKCRTVNLPYLGDMLEFQLPADSRAHLHDVNEIDEMISRNKSGYLDVTVNDAAHFKLRVPLAGSKIMERIGPDCGERSNTPTAR